VKKIRFSHAASAAIIALLSLVISACDNGYGIFSEIQKELDTRTPSLFRHAAVNDIVRAGSAYYASMSKVYARSTVSGSPWALLALGGATTAYESRGIASDSLGPSLYLLSYYTAEGAYHLDKYTGTTWSTIALPSGLATDEVPHSIRVVNDLLFLETQKTVLTLVTYSLFYLNGASWTTTGLVDVEHHLVDGAWDGSAYWFIAGTDIYSGAAGALTASSESARPSAVALCGIMADGTDLYVSAGDGTLHKRSGSNAWTAYTVSSGVKLAGLVRVTTSASDLLVVGTDAAPTSTVAKGYFELSRADLSLAPKQGDGVLVAGNSSNFGASFENLPVTRFFNDYAGPGDQNLFACLVGSGSSTAIGLYRNAWNGTAWSGWKSE
jgi:hypothetical protein